MGQVRCVRLEPGISPQGLLCWGEQVLWRRGEPRWRARWWAQPQECSNTTSTTHSVSGRHCAGLFAHTISTPGNSSRWMVLPPFYRWENQGSGGWLPNWLSLPHAASVLACGTHRCMALDISVSLFGPLLSYLRNGYTLMFLKLKIWCIPRNTVCKIHQIPL